MSTVTSSVDRVILVHGTFAAEADDVGDSWWQEGSDTWDALQRKLPKGTKLAAQSHVFHWSGENSERARIKAGQDLLEIFREFEEEGICYHVIGHSHGGSVIWHALRMAELQNLWLPRLRSWATVGTPFLQQQTRSRWSLINGINIFLALILLKPAYVTFSRLVQYSIASLTGGDVQVLASNSESQIVQVIRAPALRLLEGLGIPIDKTGANIQFGSFDPSQGDSLVAHMLTTPQGLTIVFVAVLYIYILLNLAFFFLSPVLESLRLRAEKRLEHNCSNRFRDRWMGIWSPDDEAINSLKATLSLSISFVAKMAPRERVLFSDSLALVSRPYYWILAPIFNRYIRPALDGVIRTYIAKTAQGNNRPAAEVIGVSPIPAAIQSQCADYPALPSWLNDQIVESSNHYMVDLAPKLRRLLSSTCILSGLDAFGHEISGRELVHTSYFDHPEVQSLLAMHIAWSINDVPQLLRVSRGDQRLMDWYQEFREVAGRPIVSSILKAAEQQNNIPLLQPRRRKAA